ncbi:MAG: FecR domain-containing protein [Hyphomicrobiales bacterium]|nr:FecR domain-containing protein [Hyphomicrobiales bacterium]
MGRVFAHRVTVAGLSLGLMAMTGGFASAQQKIGVAAVVQNDVARVQAASAAQISQGDNLIRDEVVRTGAASTAKLVFLDDTNLAVGPTSTVTLDKFVFAGESDYRKATLEVARGSLRFVTGNSDKRAYQINTSVASIGVRGTVFDMQTTRGRMVVTLVEGLIIVCIRGTNRCLIASQPGQTIVVNGSSIAFSAAGFSFDTVCATGATGLCGVSKVASLQQPGGGDALCGR